MEERTIEDISYIFKKCKENKQPMPIVFLGAGTSASAGIP
jgi:NAD-dependent SIR2 family protein deacetylase